MSTNSNNRLKIKSCFLLHIRGPSKYASELINSKNDDDGTTSSAVCEVTNLQSVCEIKTRHERHGPVR